MRFLVPVVLDEIRSFAIGVMTFWNGLMLTGVAKMIRGGLSDHLLLPLELPDPRSLMSIPFQCWVSPGARKNFVVGKTNTDSSVVLCRLNRASPYCCCLLIGGQHPLLTAGNGFCWLAVPAEDSCSKGTKVSECCGQLGGGGGVLFCAEL